MTAVYGITKGQRTFNRKPRTVHHCRVLPPSRCNSTIPVSLLIDAERFVVIALMFPRTAANIVSLHTRSIVGRRSSRRRRKLWCNWMSLDFCVRLAVHQNQTNYWITVCLYFSIAVLRIHLQWRQQDIATHVAQWLERSTLSTHWLIYSHSTIPFIRQHDELRKTINIDHCIQIHSCICNANILSHTTYFGAQHPKMPLPYRHTLRHITDYSKATESRITRYTQSVCPFVPCQPSTRKRNIVQRSNFQGQLLTWGITNRATLGWKLKIDFGAYLRKNASIYVKWRSGWPLFMLHVSSIVNVNIAHHCRSLYALMQCNAAAKMRSFRDNRATIWSSAMRHAVKGCL